MDENCTLLTIELELTAQIIANRPEFRAKKIGHKADGK